MREISKKNRALVTSQVSKFSLNSIIYMLYLTVMFTAVACSNQLEILNVKFKNQELVKNNKGEQILKENGQETRWVPVKINVPLVRLFFKCSIDPDVPLKKVFDALIKTQVIPVAKSKAEKIGIEAKNIDTSLGYKLLYTSKINKESIEVNINEFLNDFADGNNEIYEDENIELTVILPDQCEQPKVVKELEKVNFEETKNEAPKSVIKKFGVSEQLTKPTVVDAMCFVLDYLDTRTSLLLYHFLFRFQNNEKRSSNFLNLKNMFFEYWSKRLKAIRVDLKYQDALLNRHELDKPAHLQSFCMVFLSFLNGCKVLEKLHINGNVSESGILPMSLALAASEIETITEISFKENKLKNNLVVGFFTYPDLKNNITKNMFDNVFKNLKSINLLDTKVTLGILPKILNIENLGALENLEIKFDYKFQKFLEEDHAMYHKRDILTKNLKTVKLHNTQLCFLGQWEPFVHYEFISALIAILKPKKKGKNVPPSFIMDTLGIDMEGCAMEYNPNYIMIQ